MYNFKYYVFYDPQNEGHIYYDGQKNTKLSVICHIHQEIEDIFNHMYYESISAVNVNLDSFPRIYFYKITKMIGNVIKGLHFEFHETPYTITTVFKSTQDSSLRYDRNYMFREIIPKAQIL